jgi:hypothetical protein
MFSRLIKWLANHWGLAVLLLFLLAVSAVNYQSKVNVLGWDNFSVSLDLPQNIWRTIFATWREYRAFGVPSDSEVTDIFRQLVLLFLTLIWGSTAIDAVYYLLLGSIGVVGTYALSRSVLKNSVFPLNTFIIESASLISGFYYFFNFHTLEQFQFPVVMYIIRYAMFPWGIWSFIHLLQTHTLRKSHLLMFVIISLLLSGSYLTATVFFTYVIIMGAVIISYPHRIKRALLLLGIFILLNAFWFLPFTNYYLEKATLIPKASTFVEVNEALLNKPASNYSWNKILTFYPETITKEALPFKELSTDTAVSVVKFDLDSYYQISVNQARELFLLGLIAIGLLAVLFEVVLKKKFQHSWIVLLTLSMVFVLRKDTPPFGFLYELLDTFIPFFSIIFRFGGAKFYPLLLLAMTQALAVGVAVIFLLIEKVQLKKLRGLYRALLLSIVLLLLVFPYVSIFAGNVFNNVVKVAIPPEYSEVADVIDAHTNQGRVLHLPIDDYSYWKSYQWGYFGSAFIQNYLEKPLVDRTFEPASIELDNFFVALTRISTNAHQLSDESLAERANELFDLLHKTNTAFIIFDESVSTDLETHQLQAWGVFRGEDYQSLLEKMMELGLINEIDTRHISSDETQLTSRLITYEVQNSHGKVRSIPTVTNIDQQLENTFITPLLTTNLNFIQSSQLSYRTFPFWQPKKELIQNSADIQLQQQLPSTQTVNEATLALAENSSIDAVLLKVSVRKTIDNDLEIFAQESVLPVFTEEMNSLLPVMTIPSTAFEDDTSELLLQVDNSIIKLPSLSSISLEQTELATVLVSVPDYTITLFNSATQHTISGSSFDLTEDPNCFDDASNTYSYSFTASRSSFDVETIGGMTCVSTPLVDATEQEVQSISEEKYYQVDFTLDSQTETVDTQPVFPLSEVTQLQSAVRQELQSLKPYVQIGVCVLDIEQGDCLNTHYFLAGNQKNTVSLLTDRGTSATHSQLLITVPANQQYQHTVTFSDLSFREYVPIFSAEVSVDQTALEFEHQLSLADSVLNLTLPKVISPQTYQFISGQSAFDYSTQECPTGGYRSMKANGTGFYSYQENCFQNAWTRVPFESTSMYLWQTAYHVFSGKHPQFILRGPDQLKRELISRFNMYPAVPGFKSLQQADRPWWSPRSYETFVQDTLAEAEYKNEHTTVYPLGEFASDSTLSYELFQGNEGQGLVGVREMNIWQFPGYWQSLAVDVGGSSQHTFQEVQVFETQRILPSLWKAVISGPADSKENQILLELDQAYDRQWEIYQTQHWLLAFLGVGHVNAQQVKTNGWSNGWIINEAELPSSSMVTLYFFYTPERIAILGWLITGLTIASITGVYTLRKFRKS